MSTDREDADMARITGVETMNQIDERQRSINAKLERLRKRVAETVADKAVRAVLLGLIDLLGDEL